MKCKATITFEFDTEDYDGEDSTESAKELVDEMIIGNESFPDDYKVEVTPC